MSQPEKHVFQAEIQQLLEIVIHSLYTDREVFLRELISNAADACEKLRFLQAGGTAAIHDPERPLTISVNADEKAGTITVTDTGIGMTRAELVDNLGTIAHSGTKAFLQAIAANQKPDARLIGQFGVGFYSAFMVARKVTVETRSHQPEETGWRWVSEGATGYDLEPADELARGTRITLELKEDAREFARTARVEGLIRRYSNFVAFPIELEGRRINTVQAIWARNKAEVKEEEYTEFYRFVAHDSEAPMYRLHFTADAPLAIQALLFIPPRNFEVMGMSRQEPSVHLYCRKILIDPHAHGLLPDWLRFVRGVVDSEDLPLNVSRERMQDSELLKRLNRALTGRLLKFLGEESGKEPAAYDKFHDQYHRFLKEGLLSDFEHREAIGRLLRYESSGTEPGKRTSLAEYVSRMPTDQKEIYFLLATDRAAAEASPSFEAFRARKFEVLFVHEPLDEFVMDRLGEFEGKAVIAAEKAEVTAPPPESSAPALTDEQAKALAAWMKETLKSAVEEVRVSQRLVESPVLVRDHDQFMTATMRRTLRQMGRDAGGIAATPPDLEINSRHAVIVRLDSLRESDSELAGQVTEQLLDNARLAAGLLEDTRPMLQRIERLLERVVKPA